MPKNFYPALIIALLGSFLLFSTWSAYLASTEGTDITDRDYYSKGLKYNSTMVEKRAATVLGWNLTTTFADQKLQLRLTDNNGQPVNKATGKLILFQRLVIPLNELQPGIYQAKLPDNLQGSIAVRVDFERQGARLNRQLLINI